jgi:diguanylate cyclase (GGDEF)-like protein
MKKSFIDKNKKIVIIFIVFFIIFSIISFIKITKEYTKLEKNIQDTNISNLVEKIQTKIEYNHNIALEYSTSDEVYNFIENTNKKYIHSNFRKGSYTLQDVALSYFILTDKNSNIKYSKFTNTRKTDDFIAFVIKELKNTKKTNKIILYKNEAFYLSKTPIYKTNYENNSNGFLYLGSKIDNKETEYLKRGFQSFKFISNPKLNTKENSFKNIEAMSLKVKVQSEIENNINMSEISFYNQNSNLLFTVKVKRETTLVSDIKNITLIIFLCLLLIAIFTLLYTSNKYQHQLIKQHNSIEKCIENKTSDMKISMEELKKVNENLYEIAHTDFLTKTMNRRNFFIHAQNHFSIAKANDHLLCVVMIDIDNFKKFNDKYGHNVGDKVLVLFAQKIKNNISKKTIFGRLGGEEFALVISNSKLENAIEKAESLKKKIEEIELIIDGNVLKITASFGVSDNQNCSNIDEMLQKADTLLYTAKESGRNLVRSRLNFC